jgi:hypothetical protein
MAWKMLIDLALRYGWKPAGAQKLEMKDDPAEEQESSEGGLGKLWPLPVNVPGAPVDKGLAQAVKSVLFQSNDPVVDSYFKNAGFRVTAQDAWALAEALERALPDVPNHDALAGKTVELPVAPGERFLPLGTPVNPFEWFSGENRRHLVGFIAFCWQGGFDIC